MSVVQLNFSAASEPKPILGTIGIDLGTTYSLVGVLGADGTVEILKDAQGQILLPSAVLWDSEGVWVGHDALAKGAAIVSSKRWMGAGEADLATLGLPTTYDFSASTEQQVLVMTAQGPKSAVEVAAEILKTLKARAVDQGVSAQAAVITVPAFFNESQRRMVIQAAELAGLQVLRLINEPTAAALAYGLEDPEKGQQGQHYAIYDFGGGTFDISILGFYNGIFEVKASCGDLQLGGDDLDNAIMAWVTTEVIIADAAKPALKELVSSAKQSLSTCEAVVLELKTIGIDKSLTLTRTHLEQLIAPFIQKTIQLLDKALHESQLDTDALAGILLVGGSSKIPLVRQTLEQQFGRPVYCDLNPEAVVVIGATYQAAQLAGQVAANRNWLLLDVVPLSLGLETMGGIVEKILPRNTTVPAVAESWFTTYEDGQTGFVFHIVQGERELASDNRSLATFMLKNLPPKPKGMVKVKVVFKIDLDGLLSIEAYEPTSEQQVEIQLHPTYGVDTKTYVTEVKKAIAMAESDLALKAQRLAAVENRSILQESLDA